MKRIALTTLGSLGDLYPMMGLALSLRERGHEITIATSEVHRKTVEAEEIPFVAIRPTLDPSNPELIDAVLDRYRGSERLHRNFIFPVLRDSVADFQPLAEQSDLVISGIIAYHASICAEITQKPWLSCVYVPLTMYSAYDPPVFAPIPWLGRMRCLGPGFHRWAIRFLMATSKPWARSLLELRAELGLRHNFNPFTEGLRSDRLLLALFSPHFAAPQPDWPSQTRATGFIFYDGPRDTADSSSELEAFLQSGEPPILVTLGSTSVHKPGAILDVLLDYFEQSGVRALMVVGGSLLDTYKKRQTSQIHVSGYLPYSKIMPKASMVIHQGGIGTTAHALKAGLPMTIIPWANDTYDNAERIRRLGVGDYLPLNRLSSDRISKRIEGILDNPAVRNRANELRQRLDEEDGPQSAARAIEETYG